MRKFFEIIICLLLIASGVVAGMYQTTQISGNDLGLFDGLKIAFITYVVFYISIIILFFILIHINSKYEMEIMYLAYIPYLVILYIFSFQQLGDRFSNIIMKVIMAAIVTAVQGCIPLLLCTSISDAGLSNLENKPKEKRIKATTINWTKKWSTTTYRDEDGNETKIDHLNL